MQIHDNFYSPSTLASAVPCVCAPRSASGNHTTPVMGKIRYLTPENTANAMQMPKFAYLLLYILETTSGVCPSLVMVGVTVLDKRTNEWLRGVTKVLDAVREYRKRKWRYAVKIAGMDNGRWVKKVTEWWPILGKRKVGRPRRRWRDELCKYAGTNWMATARSQSCDICQEAFIRNEL